MNLSASVVTKFELFSGNLEILASGATSLWVCPTIRKCTCTSTRAVFIKTHRSQMRQAIVVEFFVSLGVLSAPTCRTRGRCPSTRAAVWRFMMMDEHCMLAPCGPSSNNERRWCVSLKVPDHTDPLRPQTTRVPSSKSGELSLTKLRQPLRPTSAFQTAVCSCLLALGPWLCPNRRQHRLLLVHLVDLHEPPAPRMQRANRKACRCNIRMPET